MAEDVHVGDIGTKFVATIMDGAALVDVSSATTQQFVLKPESGASKTVTTTFTTDGTDGKIEYTTILNDIDTAGIWKLQAYIVLATGTWRSDIYWFKVDTNL